MLLPQEIDDVVGDQAALVVTLVEHERLLVELRIKVTIEIRVSGAAGVGHVNVGHGAAGQRVNLAAIRVDPIEIAQTIFGRHRNDRDVAGLGALCSLPDAQHRLLAGRTIKKAVDVVGGPAIGEDATDYFVGTRGGLSKSVLFDEREHRVVKPRLGDRKDRVVKYGDGQSKQRLSALKYLGRVSHAGIGTPFLMCPNNPTRLHHPAPFRQMLSIISR